MVRELCNCHVAWAPDPLCLSEFSPNTINLLFFHIKKKDRLCCLVGHFWLSLGLQIYLAITPAISKQATDSSDKALPITKKRFEMGNECWQHIRDIELPVLIIISICLCMDQRGIHLKRPLPVSGYPWEGGHPHHQERIHEARSFRTGIQGVPQTRLPF